MPSMSMAQRYARRALEGALIEPTTSSVLEEVEVEMEEMVTFTTSMTMMTLRRMVGGKCSDEHGEGRGEVGILVITLCMCTAVMLENLYC